jgi:hypothetical protein
MAVNKKNIMTRYFFVILLMGLIGVAIVVKAGITMFAERQYWPGCGRTFRPGECDGENYTRKHHFVRRRTDGQFAVGITDIFGLPRRWGVKRHPGV